MLFHEMDNTIYLMMGLPGIKGDQGGPIHQALRRRSQGKGPSHIHNTVITCHNTMSWSQFKMDGLWATKFFPLESVALCGLCSFPISGSPVPNSSNACEINGNEVRVKPSTSPDRWLLVSIFDHIWGYESLYFLENRCGKDRSNLCSGERDQKMYWTMLMFIDSIFKDKDSPGRSRPIFCGWNIIEHHGATTQAVYQGPWGPPYFWAKSSNLTSTIKWWLFHRKPSQFHGFMSDDFWWEMTYHS